MKKRKNRNKRLRENPVKKSPKIMSRLLPKKLDRKSSTSPEEPFDVYGDMGFNRPWTG